MTRPKNINVTRVSQYATHYDDFPTPPWGTRAFFEYVVPELRGKNLQFLEPSCGRGHMVQVLKEEKFKNVWASDLIDYKSGFETADYTMEHQLFGNYDVMLTNPPYKLANQFALRALKEAKIGVAMLLRTIWMESSGRYASLFKDRPPTRVFVFSKRMPAAHGRLVRKQGAMMSHAWFWWDKRDKSKKSQLGWIPPEAQRLLERDEDYK